MLSSIAWSEVLPLTMSPVELIVRGTLVYWFLFLLFRFVLRRDVGSFGVSDVLFVVLLGDASQNAMIGKGISVADSALLIATLAGWNLLIDYVCWKWPRLEQILQGRRICIYRTGRLLRRAMRRELITLDEVISKLHQNGQKSLDEAEAIFLEPSGELTVVPKKR